jgi:DNA topoisomerase IA
MALFQTGETTAELSRPAISAQMEAEVNLIAQNQLEQRVCMARNLEWFRSCYVELGEIL